MEKVGQYLILGGTSSHMDDAMTHLLSLPRANWSFAAVHSFSRPARSQAVHAGSLLSH